MKKGLGCAGLVLAVPVVLLLLLTWVLFGYQPSEQNPDAPGPVGVCPPTSGGPHVVPAVGKSLNGSDTAARAALRAGWAGHDALMATAIAGAESGWAHDSANTRSTARGMWQIMMSYHASKFHGASWMDPYANAKVAHIVWSDAHGWGPWVTYTNGAYRAYLPEASRAISRVLAQSRGTSAPTQAPAALRAAPVASRGTSSSRAVSIDGQQLSDIAVRQLHLAEQIGHIHLRVIQGGYGGNHVAASGTSHNYPGVADIAPGSIYVETLLRTVGFAAWARNVPGRSQVGFGAHVHAVSLLDKGDMRSPQVYGSWAHHGNGLSGTFNDPAIHPPLLPQLASRVRSDITVPPTTCAA